MSDEKSAHNRKFTPSAIIAQISKYNEAFPEQKLSLSEKDIKNSKSNISQQHISNASQKIIEHKAKVQKEVEKYRKLREYAGYATIAFTSMLVGLLKARHDYGINPIIVYGGFSASILDFSIGFYYLFVSQENINDAINDVVLINQLEEMLVSLQAKKVEEKASLPCILAESVTHTRSETHSTDEQKTDINKGDIPEVTTISKKPTKQTKQRSELKKGGEAALAWAKSHRKKLEEAKKRNAVKIEESKRKIETSKKKKEIKLIEQSSPDCFATLRSQPQAPRNDGHGGDEKGRPISAPEKIATTKSTISPTDDKEKPPALSEDIAVSRFIKELDAKANPSLQSALEPAFHFMQFIEKIAPGSHIFLVGSTSSCVLAGELPNDFDFVSNIDLSDPKIMAELEKAGFSVKKSELSNSKDFAFYTIKVPYPLSPGMKPIFDYRCNQKITPASLSDDLAEYGDFTDTAIYVDPNGHVYDPHKSLALNELRHIHKPKLCGGKEIKGMPALESAMAALSEDPTRVFRLLRKWDKEKPLSPVLKKILFRPDLLKQIFKGTGSDRQAILRAFDTLLLKRLRPIVGNHKATPAEINQALHDTIYRSLQELYNLGIFYQVFPGNFEFKWFSQEMAKTLCHRYYAQLYSNAKMDIVAKFSLHSGTYSPGLFLPMGTSSWQGEVLYGGIVQAPGMAFSA